MACCRQAKNRYTKYDASSPSLPWPPKPEVLFTPEQQPQIFDKFSRAPFAKNTSYNWRNGEAIYLALHTRYCLFDIQKNIFRCKTHLAWYEISVFFFVLFCFVYFAFRNMHYIRLNRKNSFKLKISVNVLDFHNSTLGLKFGYISYQMSFKKSMTGLKGMGPCL